MMTLTGEPSPEPQQVTTRLLAIRELLSIPSLAFLPGHRGNRKREDVSGSISILRPHVNIKINLTEQFRVTGLQECKAALDYPRGFATDRAAWREGVGRGDEAERQVKMRNTCRACSSFSNLH